MLVRFFIDRQTKRKKGIDRWIKKNKYIDTEENLTM